MTKHSVLPPSSAARRMQCPGSRKLESLYPDVDSPHAREGHAAHWVALQALTEKIVVAGERTPDSELITAEMIEGAALYVDYVKSVIAENKNAGFEMPLMMPSIHSEAWGTCDCLAYDEDNKKLHIWDYKFGHRFISVVENWQLLYYAIGAIDTLGVDPLEIICHIVQPRYYGVEGRIQQWAITREKLNEYACELKLTEEIAMSEKAQLKVGDECMFCSARHVCPALQEINLVLCDFSHTAMSNELTPQKLGYELRTLLNAQNLLKARITGLSQEAENLLVSGKRVPGFILLPGRSNHVWDKSAEEVIEMGKLLGVNLAKPSEAITPKQAIKANVPQEVIAKYSKIIPGEMKLTEDKK